MKMSKNAKQIVVAYIMCFAASGYLLAQDIKVNQLGFYKQSQKIAVVPGATASTFDIVDQQTSKVVFTGNLSASKNWDLTGENNIRVADFTDFKTNGTFVVKSGSMKSHPFVIADKDLLDELSTWSIKAFYLWRASTPIESRYATFRGIDFARAAGHMDDAAVIHSSAATTKRPAGTVISSSKGWYDAGDYNKYVVNASPAVFPMLHAFELYPEYYKNLNLNIPESSNSVPDILDEIKWETDWLLTMQDPNDGGVYFKLTDASFCGFVMPDKAPQSPRYLVAKSTTATLDFAAMLAKASRSFKKYETTFPGYAKTCLDAAKKAMLWAKANPKVYFNNPSGISTGGYGDGNATDEFFWAQIELFLATNDQTYLLNLPMLSNFDAPSWGGVQTNGLLSAMLVIDTIKAPADVKTSFRQAFSDMADRMVSSVESNPYKSGATYFGWGCNGGVASMGMVLGAAYSYFDNNKYLNAAVSNLDYLLGRNATPYSFVTGFGDVSPMNIHDRRAGADGIVDPLPGYLVGGPNNSNQNDNGECGASAYPSALPGKSYVDKQCSFSSNEIAINWNGPLVFLVGAIDAIYSGTGVSPLAVATDQGGSVITVEYAEKLSPFKPGDVSYNVLVGGVARRVGSVTIDPTRGSVMKITLLDPIVASDHNITISSSKDSVFVVTGSRLLSLDNVPVVNNVTGSAPVPVLATTSTDGLSMVITFNKPLALSDTLRAGFSVMANGIDMFKNAVVDPTQPTKIIVSTGQLYKFDNITVSYSGSVVTSSEGGSVKPFDALAVVNVAPDSPSRLASASTLEDGYSLSLVFDKLVAAGSAASKVSVSVKRKPGTTQATIDTVIVSSVSVTVVLDERLTNEDSVFVTSLPGGITTKNGDPIMSFVHRAVTNSLPKTASVPVVGFDSTTTLEAENYSYNNGFKTESCSDVRAGLNLGYTDKGDWVDYIIDVKDAGTYTVEARVASQSTASVMLIQTIDGKDTSSIATIKTPATGGWQVWQTVSQSIELKAGKQMIRVYAKGELFNLNWLRFFKKTFSSSSMEQEFATVYPNPCQGKCFVKTTFDHDVIVTNITGVYVTTVKANAGIPVELLLEPGMYIIDNQLIICE